MIIAIEGVDAAGKNTQARKLAETFVAGGVPTVVMSFPDYETESGQVILGNLQQKWAAKEHHCNGSYDRVNERTNALALQSIFVVNRYERADEIRAHVRAGRTVILDRYWLSGVVYGSCDGLDEGWLARIHTSLPQPDVWILLDVPPEASLERRPERRDRYEADANMGRRRDIYLRWFEERRTGASTREDVGSVWQIVDGVGAIDEVHARIVSELRRLGRDFVKKDADHVQVICEVK